jgi:hypothetical protein
MPEPRRSADELEDNERRRRLQNSSVSEGGPLVPPVADPKARIFETVSGESEARLGNSHDPEMDPPLNQSVVNVELRHSSHDGVSAIEGVFQALAGAWVI